MVLYERVAIIGIGLMGGSLGMALRARGLAREVVGIDTNPVAVEDAMRKGAVDAGTTDLLAGVRNADSVIFATPVGITPDLMEKAVVGVRPDALVTDLGSAKQRIVATGTRIFGARFVGGHPMAGSEQSGLGAARSDLFEGAPWAIVRPEPLRLEEDAEALQLAELVTALGAKPIALDAPQHDRLVALVSHLPHLLAFAFAQTVGGDSEATLAKTLAAGSYRDMVRVARANPGLWRDIFLDNREALLAALALFEERLAALRQALDQGDGEKIRSEIVTANECVE